jgi:hypothetical protein
VHQTTQVVVVQVQVRSANLLQTQMRQVVMVVLVFKMHFLVEQTTIGVAVAVVLLILVELVVELVVPEEAAADLQTLDRAEQVVQVTIPELLVYQAAEIQMQTNQAALVVQTLVVGLEHPATRDQTPMALVDQES